MLYQLSYARVGANPSRPAAATRGGREPSPTPLSDRGYAGVATPS